MRPIHFPEATTTLAPPNGITEEDCDQLPLQVGECSHTTFPMMTSCWELDDADIEDIIKTRKIHLTILHNEHPMVMVSVVNPQVL